MRPASSEAAAAVLHFPARGGRASVAGLGSSASHWPPFRPNRSPDNKGPNRRARTPTRLEYPAAPGRPDVLFVNRTSTPDRQRPDRRSIDSNSFVIGKNPSSNKFGARRENREVSAHGTVVIRQPTGGNPMNYAAAAAASDSKLTAADRVSATCELFIYLELLLRSFHTPIHASM